MAVVDKTPSSSETLRTLGPKMLPLAAAVVLLYYGRNFLITLLVAFGIYFILDPIVSLAMRLRLPRGLASFLVCALALALVYLVGVGTYTQVAELVDDLPHYSQRIGELSDKLVAQVERVEKAVADLAGPRKPKVQPAAPAKPPRARRKVEPAMPAQPAAPVVQEVRILPERPPLLDYVYEKLPSFYNALLMASFVPFLVYFMLSWRDHMTRAFLNFFHGHDRVVARDTMEGIAHMARAYTFGNFLLGLLLSVVSATVFYLFHVPFWLLVGPLSGFFSLVPYLGLPLAMLPPFFTALTVYNSLTAYIVIGSIVAFLHLIALNLLYPKLVGSRVHLNPLAVTIALMFWGVLWGGIGLVMAIPITAGIKAVCDNVPELKVYGKLLGD